MRLVLTDFEGRGIHEIEAVLLGAIPIRDPLHEEDDIRGRLVHQGVEMGVVGDPSQLLGEMGEEVAVVMFDILDTHGKAEETEGQDGFIDCTYLTLGVSIFALGSHPQFLIFRLLHDMIFNKSGSC